ncbi:uncharacterized protein LOC119490659 [Sebastes umbrosus]|uniref:uncharacterized protein LOC119490659 n=1 Tax=Sebastes umbrosus TaxID=72105 RepID=UPI0018A0D781|nr:uncharacterized protein LOC119490659 [Sebastes umbrosus]
MDVFSRPELFDFHGVWMTHYFTDNWENVQNFQARPDDILLVSYPKAGSTWVSYILDLLCFGQTFPERDTSIPLTARVLHLEIAITSLQLGTEDLDKCSTSPRLIRTHLPVQFLPKSFWEQNCKIVYVARNAKDSVVSYFHFERMSEIHPEPGEWSSSCFCGLSLCKFVCNLEFSYYSSYFSKTDSHTIQVTFPKRCCFQDTGREMDKLCCFLGLSPSSEEKERITGRVQFDGMKENNMVNQSSFRALDFKKSSFMRKGKVGDWKNHFTVAQHEKFDEDYKQKMKNPSLQFQSRERASIRITYTWLNLVAPPQPGLAYVSFFFFKMDALSRAELFDFHGVPMTQYFTDNWENIQNFQARPDDILLVSYPKAGSTWVSYILDLLYFGQTFPERETSIPLTERVLHLEIAIPSLLIGLGHSSPMIRGTRMLDRCSTSPRLIRTHLPVQFLPKSFWEQNCKIVYVARNAKDSVVSYFHYQRMSKIQPEPGEWSSYPQRFMEGKMPFGSWYDHVSGWWEKKQSHPKLHYMFYEDLIEDTGREMDKLCCFLGLSPSSEEKERITGRVQFDDMKENNMVNMSLFGMMDFKKSSFMRKGKVGDWKNHFTVAQDEKFDEDYKQKMKNPSLQFRTEV